MALRLLIVDDSKVMREMIAACLRPIGEVMFDFAGSGLEAIERLALAPYALVVLDLNMPDVGGIEVIEFVRAQDKLKTLPILVLTTRGDEGSRVKVLQAGASKYMTKPFTPDTIMREVGGMLDEQADVA
jgi:two-component system chemotaxis response regulator CheY